MRCASFCCWWCCIPTLVVGQIKGIVETKEENGIVLSIISEVDRLVPIRNFITYFDNRELGKRFAVAPALQQSLMEAFERPVIVAGTKIGVLHNFINSENLAVIFFNGIQDPMLSVAHKSLNGLQSMWSIFVYKTDGILASTTILIEAFFNWCYNTNFDNVMLVLKRNNEYEIWSFEIKWRMRIFQFSVKTIGQAISHKFCNHGEMGQYRSLVAVFQSLPDAFVYNSSKNGTPISLGGNTGLLLKSFIQHINGSMDILPLSYDEYIKKVPQDCTQERCIDIGANMLSNFSVSPQSPVLRVTQTCLVLPYDSWIALEVYPVSFDKKFSLLIFIVFFTVVYAVIKRIANPRISLGASLFSCFRLAAGQSIPGRTFRRLGLPEKLIEVFTQIYNLLIVSLFGSALATALITGLRKPEILDTETFLASGLQIMVFPEQVQSLFDYIPHALSNRLIVEDQSARDRHVYSLNNSYAYVMETHKWIILEFIQRRLRKPKLRLGPQALCSAQRYLRFHMRSGLCFARALKQFAIQAHETGLASKKWLQLGLRQAEASGMLSQAPYDPLIRQPLQIKFYGEVFFFYSLGMFLSLVTLVLECLCAYWRTRNTVIIV